MAKVTSSADLGKVQDSGQFMRFCSQLVMDLLGVVNGKLEFDANILSQTVSTTFPSANVNLTVSHNLNKTGVNFIVVSKDVACDVYRGTGSDTATSILLRSTVAGAKVTLILI